MNQLALILGGVRSGKSRFAQELAAKLGGDDVLFVATAQAGDTEMSRRIEHHRRERPAGWTTLEQPLGIGRAVERLKTPQPVILLDCLTLLVSNVLMQSGAETAQQAVRREVDQLLESAASRPASWIIVSGEVGSGVVPESPMGRLYRDLLGWTNQQLARHARATYWMVAGAAVNVTATASTTEQAADALAGASSSFSHSHR